MIAGLDIGGTKCALSLGTDDNRVTELLRFPTAGPDETIARLCDAIKDRLPEPPRRVGISAGTLKAASGLISGAPNLPGWDDVPITRIIEDRVGAPTFLMNDAKACALAEWIFGAGRGCRHMAFLTAGTGMGSGLILNEQLYLGGGNAGEVGHVRLAPDGPWGYGKHGSFEGFCSGGGIGRWARARVAQGANETALAKVPAEALSARVVIEAAGQGDPLALELLRDVGTRLGEALAILVDVLNLERVVLGSVYVRARAFLEPSMRAALAREALPDLCAQCEIVPAELGENVGNYGAIAVARYLGGK